MSAAWHHGTVLECPDSLAALQYQHSIAVSVAKLLEGFRARLPVAPALFVWSGPAQQLYSEELGRLRDTLWLLQSEVDDTVTTLTLRLGAHA